MPIGVIVNSLAIAIGGFIGAKWGSRLSAEFKEKLNLIFGVCAMGIGISSIVLMENLPAVILSLILGTIVGILIRLGTRLEHAGARLAKLFPGQGSDTALLVTTVVLFCASGTGVYGSIVSGMSGDHSILLAKSILDLFTAMIFACSLGTVVSAIAIPQFIIFFLLFLLARVILPLTTPAMIMITATVTTTAMSMIMCTAMMTTTIATAMSMIILTITMSIPTAIPTRMSTEIWRTSDRSSISLICRRLCAAMS